MSKVLEDIKKMLGVSPSDSGFETDINIHVNTSVNDLYMLGVVTVKSVDDNTTWDQLLSNREDLVAAKSYIYLSVRLVFDPPDNSFKVKAFKDERDRYGWMLGVQAEEEV